MRKKILIVDDLHPAFVEQALKLGYECTIEPLFTRQQTLAVLSDYEGLAIRTKFQVDKEVLDAGSKLHFIARAGAGMDNIDEQYARTKGIYCINAPEGNADAVGEHALGMLLSLMNNLRKSDIEVRNGIWDREGNRGWELKGKTVGIIGYGFMGQSFARKLSGLQVEVIAYDKYKTGFSDQFAREVSMEEIVKKSQVLSLHIPLTCETRGLVNEEYLFHFRNLHFFINTARGEIVKSNAILGAIKDAKLLGAALDVLETEKFPALAEQEWYEELRQSDRVLLSPHVAGWTFDSYRKISEVLGQKLKNLEFET